MNTLTANKTIDFEKLLPDFKRFAASKNLTRPILKYINFDGQYLTVTDSHRLIRINAENVSNLPSQDPFIYDVYEKKIVTSASKYPDVNRLIPDYYNTEFTINHNQFQAMRSSLNDLMQNVKKVVNNVIEFDVTNQTLTLSDREALSIGHDINKTGEDTTLYLNCKYLIDALMSVNKLNKLSENDITIGITGKLRPVTIKQENVFNIIILPVRVY